MYPRFVGNLRLWSIIPLRIVSDVILYESRYEEVGKKTKKVYDFYKFLVTEKICTTKLIQI